MSTRWVQPASDRVKQGQGDSSLERLRPGKGGCTMKRLLVLVVMLGLALPLCAQEEPTRLDRAQERVAEFLQLGDEQLAQWDELLTAQHETVQPLREAIEASGQELAEMLDGQDPDATVVGELAISIHGMRQEIRDARQQYLEGFEALLDEEQAGRLGFIRRAERARPLIPAFEALGLLP